MSRPPAAPHLPPARREHWVGRGLARAADGRTVLERLAPHLGLDDARTYLERLIVPEEPREHELPFASVDERRPSRRLGRDDEITLSGLGEVAAYLARDDVLDIEERLLSTRFKYLIVADDGSRSSNIPPSFLGGTLAPALARVGEVRRALRHADGTSERRRVDAYLGIAEWTHGENRSEVLATAVAAVLDLRDVFRGEQVGRVGKAVARNAAAARPRGRRAQWQAKTRATKPTGSPHSRPSRRRSAVVRAWTRPSNRPSEC